MSTASLNAAPRARDGSTVDILISITASAATALLSLTAVSTWHTVTDRPWTVVSFVALTIGLQLTAVSIYGRGFLSVSGIGFLAVGFMFGVGPAMAVTILTAVLHWVRTRSPIHRTIFTASSWALGSAAAAAVYGAFGSTSWDPLLRLGPAFLAGAVLWVTNVAAMSLVISLADGTVSVFRVWRERYAWVTVYYLAFGPLALACTVAYEKIGPAGLVAFALPPALVLFSMQQYLDKTRESFEEVQRTNEDLKIAIEELAARNEDLHGLFEFAGGLAAQAHDRHGLVAYAESALEKLTGAAARISVGLGEAGGDALLSAGSRVGSLHLEESVLDRERWERLRDAVLPHLATAFESAELVEQVRKTHLETIAALSRSMEAKDYYTGGHTERVSDVAVALARRLGFEGQDLDSVEIGALLHDIGKIGIPERILHKPGPLDDDEWKVMKEHPVISEYILSEVDLPPIVLQIARSSHERIDGTGYPDRLSGDQIPLAARIVLVADAFDALTTDRPYRRGRRPIAALEELREHAGTQFCPIVIEALGRLNREEPHVLSGMTALRAVDVA